MKTRGKMTEEINADGLLKKLNEVRASLDSGENGNTPDLQEILKEATAERDKLKAELEAKKKEFDSVQKIDKDNFEATGQGREQFEEFIKIKDEYENQIYPLYESHIANKFSDGKLPDLNILKEFHTNLKDLISRISEFDQKYIGSEYKYKLQGMIRLQTEVVQNEIEYLGSKQEIINDGEEKLKEVTLERDNLKVDLNAKERELEAANQVHSDYISETVKRTEAMLQELDAVKTERTELAIRENMLGAENEGYKEKEKKNQDTIQENAELIETLEEKLQTQREIIEAAQKGLSELEEERNDIEAKLKEQESENQSLKVQISLKDQLLDYYKSEENDPSKLQEKVRELQEKVITEETLKKQTAARLDAIRAERDEAVKNAEQINYTGIIIGLILIAFILLLLSMARFHRKSTFFKAVDAVQETWERRSLKRTVKHYTKHHGLLAFSLIALTAAIVLLFFSLTTNPDYFLKQPKVIPDDATMTLEIRTPEKSRHFSMPFPSSKAVSVLDILNKASLQYDFSLSYDPPIEIGVLVTEIDGYKNGKDGKYWTYEVNSHYVPVAADRYFLSPDDYVKWKFDVPE